MMAILDAPPDRGGAAPSREERDIYPFVATPETLQVWLKAPGYMEWTRLDLRVSFQLEPDL